MDNTKDTPIDYKQFEGHTPGPWEVLSGYKKPWSVWSIKEQLLICARVHGDDYSQSLANAKLLAAAPELLKENQSLKLELQKQKELCKTTIALLDNIMSDMKEEGGNKWYTDQIEELIKQSDDLRKGESN